MIKLSDMPTNAPSTKTTVTNEIISYNMTKSLLSVSMQVIWI